MSDAIVGGLVGFFNRVITLPNQAFEEFSDLTFASWVMKHPYIFFPCCMFVFLVVALYFDIKNPENAMKRHMQYSEKHSACGKPVFKQTDKAKNR